MKILTILGTRPEIIRLSLIIKKLDLVSTHVLVHTGQNYDPKLTDIFFEDLGLRKPDYFLDIKTNTFGKQLSKMFKRIEEILNEIKPDKVLILGDTNSALNAIVAERMNIPVYHMEAGNRCHDLKVPEEKNRKIIDSISSIAIPYTPFSKRNLLKEGLAEERIFISGNPIHEVLIHYHEKIETSKIINQLNLKDYDYFLITIHRTENVDVEEHLKKIIDGLELVAEHFQLPLIFSVHPRTMDKIKHFKIKIRSKFIKIHEPFGFFDFVKLEKNAKLVLTDSGTVQEECCIFRVPTVTIRDTTERPETVMEGSNIISGLEPNNILSCAKIMLSRKNDWDPPIGYTDKNVSDKIVNLLVKNYDDDFNFK
ncbi:MAG: non-hydrolyzing UDP-N-acetylglucosamine 2-epimerase [Promethearchaeota archaeon]